MIKYSVATIKHQKHRNPILRINFTQEYLESLHLQYHSCTMLANHYECSWNIVSNRSSGLQQTSDQIIFGARLLKYDQYSDYPEPIMKLIQETRRVVEDFLPRPTWWAKWFD